MHYWPKELKWWDRRWVHPKGAGSMAWVHRNANLLQLKNGP